MSFFDFAFAKNVAWEQRSLSGNVFFSPKEQDLVFNLDSLIFVPLLLGYLVSMSFLFLWDAFVLQS